MKIKAAKEKIVNFVRKDTVLSAAAILAVISMCFVKPSSNYLSYIDFRVLGILFCLMTVMAGLQKNGLFDSIGSNLLERTKNTMELSVILVFLCFFFSMFITNDVALITFVPFAMLTLCKCRKEKLLIPVIVLQTLAANLGSMLTPIGNPQNLYIYNLAEMKIGEFMGIILPYTVASAVLLLVSICVICRRKEKIFFSIKKECDSPAIAEETAFLKKKTWQKNIIYLVLFVVSLSVVLRILPYYTAVVIVFVVVFFIDRSVLKTVDYSLLLTFLAFFIFTGNMGKIESVNQILQQLVSGREAVIGIAVSQVISNVPAALLLSEFTANYKELLIGVNLGGLGTLIASMASLISYRIYTRQYHEKKGKYFFCFTVANLFYLLILFIVFKMTR